MIADGDHVRIMGGIPSSITDGMLDPFFGPASRRLISWVGAMGYTDAEQATPEDQDRADALKDAEAYLVLYYAAPRMNMVVTDSGILKYKTVGVSLDEFTYLSPKELEDLRQVWLRDAQSSCALYINDTGATIGVSPANED